MVHKAFETFVCLAHLVKMGEYSWKLQKNQMLLRHLSVIPSALLPQTKRTREHLFWSQLEGFLGLGVLGFLKKNK